MDRGQLIISRISERARPGDAVGRRHEHAGEETLIAQDRVGQELGRRFRLHHQMHGKAATPQQQDSVLCPDALERKPVP